MVSMCPRHKPETQCLVSVYKATRHVQGRLYNLLMLTTTHLRRERPTCVEDTVTAFSAFASGRVSGEGAAAGAGREGLRGVVGVGGAGGIVGGSVGREPKCGEERSGGLLAKGAGMVAAGEGSGSEGRVRGVGGIKAAFSPPPTVAAAATAACCGSRDSDSTSTDSHDTAYSPGNSILADSRMWLAHFER